MSAWLRNDAFSKQGHGRKLMVIVDELPEVESALFYAAGPRPARRRIRRPALRHRAGQPSSGSGVRQVQLEEETNKAQARSSACLRRKLNNDGFDERGDAKK